MSVSVTVAHCGRSMPKEREDDIVKDGGRRRNGCESVRRHDTVRRWAKLWGARGVSKTSNESLYRCSHPESHPGISRLQEGHALWSAEFGPISTENSAVTPVSREDISLEYIPNMKGSKDPVADLCIPKASAGTRLSIRIRRGDYYSSAKLRNAEVQGG